MRSRKPRSAWLRPANREDYDSLRRVDPASEALLNDVDALKAALIAECARRLEVAAALEVDRLEVAFSSWTLAQTSASRSDATLWPPHPRS